MIEKKRQDVFDELAAIENRMKKNFDKQQNSTEDDKHDDFMDHDQEEQLHDEHDQETDHHIESTVTRAEENQTPPVENQECLNINEVKSEVINEGETINDVAKDSSSVNVDDVKQNDNENDNLEDKETKLKDEEINEIKNEENKMDAENIE